MDEISSSDDFLVSSQELANIDSTSANIPCYCLLPRLFWTFIARAATRDILIFVDNWGLR